MGIALFSVQIRRLSVLGCLSILSLSACKTEEKGDQAAVKDLNESGQDLPVAQALVGSFHLIVNGKSVKMSYRLSIFTDSSGNVNNATWSSVAAPNDVGVTSDSAVDVTFDNRNDVESITHEGSPQLEITSRSFVGGSPVLMFTYEGIPCPLSSKGASGAVSCKLDAAPAFTGPTVAAPGIPNPKN